MYTLGEAKGLLPASLTCVRGPHCVKSEMLLKLDPAYSMSSPRDAAYQWKETETGRYLMCMKLPRALHDLML